MDDWLAISMGDPAGIGPETVARAFSAGAAERCVVLGDLGVMRRTFAETAPDLTVEPVANVSEGALLSGRQVPLIETGRLGSNR